MQDEQIKALIQAPKTITKKPKRETLLINGSYRNDFELALISDKSITFTVHLRKNKKFSEHFSVILSYFVPEMNKDIFLVRYNGAHGIHKNKIIDSETIDGFHIHQATVEAIESGRNAESWAFSTKDYTTFEEAITKFWKDIKIEDDINSFFKDINVIQLSFFEKQEQI